MGRGGQGVVLRSMQRATRRNVAIKVLREGALAHPQTRARFEREVQILGQLKHPNIVTILDSGSAAGHFYFIMDFIRGEPLNIYVQVHKLDARGIVALFSKICDAVNAAHLRGIIHHAEVVGEDHPQTFDMVSYFGAFYLQHERIDEAEPLLLAGYEGLAARLGADNARTRNAAQRLVQLYEATGAADKAAEWRSKAAE